MPKVRRPLNSDGVVGKMDDDTIFSSRNGKTYRKRYAVPKQPNSESQEESKKTFAWAIKTWQRELTDEDREAWRAFARKNKEVDPFTMTQIKPPAHALFLRYATQAKQAGYPTPKKPPLGPRPYPLNFTVEKKGKGVKIHWDAPGSSPGQAQQKEGVIEFRMAVTKPWVNPWETCFRIIGYVPMKIGEHFVSPLEAEKKYTFTARVINPEGEAGLPMGKAIVLKG